MCVIYGIVATVNSCRFARRSRSSSCFKVWQNSIYIFCENGKELPVNDVVLHVEDATRGVLVTYEDENERMCKIKEIPVKTQICARTKEETNERDWHTRTRGNCERTGKSTIVKAVPGITISGLNRMGKWTSMYACIRVCIYMWCGVRRVTGS